MADRSMIEWTDATWNPIRARNLTTGKIGWHCEHASPGCVNCYSETFNAQRLGTRLPYKPGHRADVEIFLDENMLLQPLRWTRSRMIFVCSMTDLFADFVTDAMLDQIFAVMAASPHHTLQVLTKRSARMRAYLSDPDLPCRIARAWCSVGRHLREGHVGWSAQCWNAQGTESTPRVWPLPNVWLGVSAEDQPRLDERAADLVETPAVIRFISAEPLLGPLSFRWAPYDGAQAKLNRGMPVDHLDGLRRLDWIIVGGESGRGARPMHPDWVRSILDQCAAASVPFFFKQWGEFQADQIGPEDARSVARPVGHVEFRRVGKKAAGRKLFGVEHNGMPAIAPLLTSTKAAA